MIDKKYIFNITLIILAISLLLVNFGIASNITMFFGMMLFYIQLKILKYLKDFKIEKKQKIILLLYSTIFSLVTSLGKTDDLLKPDVKVVLGGNLYYILTFISIFILFYNIVLAIYKYISLNIKELKLINNKTNIKKHFLIVLGILLCWLPYFIILFPGVLSPDSIGQFEQAIGNVSLSNHHPIVSTLILKFATILGGTNIYGIAIYSIIQMFILANIFTYFIITISKTNISKIWILFIFLYFSLFNIHSLYSVTLWKDVLYGGFILLLCTKLLSIYLNNNKFKKIDLLLLGIYVTLVCLFRSNGIYIMFVLLPIVFFVYYKYRKIFYTFTIAFILSFIFKYPILNNLGISQGAYIEQVGIFTNQVAGVVYKGYDLEQQDIELIETVMPIETIKEVYNKENIDPIKFNENFSSKALEENKDKFKKLWLKLGLQYPSSYIKSYLDHTRYFWDITAASEKYYYTDVFDNDNNLYQVFNNGKSQEYLTNYFNTIQELIILQPIYNYAFIAWLLALTIIINLFRKNYKIMLILLIPFLNFLTILLATPVAMQRRYVYSLYTTIPIILIALIFNIKSSDNIKFIQKEK